MEQVIEILKTAWHGHEIINLTKAVIDPFTAVAIGSQVLGGLFGGLSSKRKARRAQQEKARLQGELRQLEKNRQPIVNPYEGISDLSSIAEDLSSKMTNPFDNLGVATQAAEIQMEQTDIALANTLDALRASGASAGGATALAQAALASKKGIAANIESQEASNEKMRASGEASLEANRIAEAQRLQGIKLSQLSKVERAGAQGIAFTYGERENREMQALNRKQAQITGQAQVQAQARADASNIMGSALGGLADIGSSYVGAKYTPGGRTSSPNNTSNEMPKINN